MSDKPENMENTKEEKIDSLIQAICGALDNWAEENTILTHGWSDLDIRLIREFARKHYAVLRVRETIRRQTCMVEKQ